MGDRRLTSEQHDQIAELREAGVSIVEIARRFDRSPSTIYILCLRIGADAPPGQWRPRLALGPAVTMRGGKPVRRFSAEEDEQIRLLAAEGLSWDRIGARVGRHTNSVRARLFTLARREARAEQDTTTPANIDSLPEQP